MKLSDFFYKIPPNLIAQYPVVKRETAKMMVVHKATGKIENKKISDILEYFDEKDVFILNNTKVFNSRIIGRKEKTGAKIEVLLQRELKGDQFLWDAIVEPARKIRVGNKLFFGPQGELVAEVTDNTTSRGRTLQFYWKGTEAEFKAKVHSIGTVYLPKYIKRKIETADYERVQTPFGKYEGSVVPTASSIHFTPELLKKLEIQGVNFAEVTMHNSLAYNSLIDVEDLLKSKMETDYFFIDDVDAKIINKGLKQRKRICAVGITSLRVVESAIDAENLVVPINSFTNKCIFPPYDPIVANSLLTSFHLPQSFLYTTACAFGGYDLITEAYKKAIKDKYRFLVYGDAMLII